MKRIIRKIKDYVNMDKNTCLKAAEEAMEKGLAHLDVALQSFRTGKASPAILAQVKVDYYGNMSSLNNIANVSILDAHTLQVQPWEKNMVGAIAKAIQEANLGLQPINSGDSVKVPIPTLTEERRKDLVKQVKAEAEKAKTVLRNARRDANEQIKKMQKDGFPEDEAKALEADIQKLLDKYTKQLEATIEAKEKDIMTV